MTIEPTSLDRPDPATAAALARLYDLDLAEDPGDLDLYLALAEALDGPDAIYLSLDIDVIDPGMAPGTGTPEPGGMLTREVLRAVRQVVGAVDLAGMDIVEVSPP